MRLYGTQPLAGISDHYLPKFIRSIASQFKHLSKLQIQENIILPLFYPIHIKS